MFSILHILFSILSQQNPEYSSGLEQISICTCCVRFMGSPGQPQAQRATKGRQENRLQGKVAGEWRETWDLGKGGVR